ncbi:glycosyl hydrolase family 2 protein [Allorhodopirellula solitaria]|nr:glycosyl hydrolase [Allorhodopirellula solitaria]
MNHSKSTVILQMVAGLAIIALCGSASAQDGLRERWLDPPPEFRLNRNLHNPQMKSTQQAAIIRETLDEGWGGFALNAPFRHYLTDEGMTATRQFCQLAKAQEMELWLYDEEGYPSGSAGGRVIRENPDWEAMGLFFTDDVVPAGPVTFPMPPGQVVTIVAFQVNNGETDFNHSIDLSNRFNRGQLKWNAPEGTWRIFAATQHSVYEGFQADRNPYRHPSPMVPEATDAFLRITHAKYAEFLGNDLGRYFTATFTDEPSSMAMPFHAYSKRHAVIPWHSVLSAAIQARYGYAPETKLIELFYDRGAAGQKVRYQYFKTVGDLIAANYFGRIGDWCHSHKLGSGGHLLLEESMVAHAALYGNIMQCFRQMDAPGIDILSCYPSNLPVHSPKLASSAAELMGHDRVMSEPCPVADKPHEPPTEAIRGFFNLLLQGGVTDFNCYLKLEHANQSERAEINTYVGRAAMLLRGGHTAADIGVVYPIESLWTEYRPRYHKVAGWQHVVGSPESVNEIDRSFRRASRCLFEHRWEYLHLDSQALIDSQPQDGRFVHDPFRFRVIVLPAVSTLPADAWANLSAFAKQGGKLVFLEARPRNSEADFPDQAVQDEFAQLIDENPNVVFLEEWTFETLNELLESWLDRPLKIADEHLPVRLAHRQIDGREVFFLVNDSAADVTTTVTFHTAAQLEEWDPATAYVHPVSRETQVVLQPWHAKIYRTMRPRE